MANISNALKKDGQFNIALAGNPNAGKTSLFNSLTGARQHVGNWPGVTVEKKEGKAIYQGKSVNIIDLPGTYSLGAYSEDEMIARDYIVKENPDVVINVVDATNLERNLYLTTQILEMNVDVVIALNMMDEAKAREIQIDVKKLSNLLGLPTIPTIATKKEGVNELLKSAVEQKKAEKTFKIDYGREIEEELETLQKVLSVYMDLSASYPLRWLAIKLLEDDKHLLKEIESKDKVIAQVEKSKQRILEVLDEEVETIIIDQRYQFIAEITKKCVKRPQTTKETLSDKIDKVVTHRIIGIPLFTVVMWLVFQFTFKLGDPLIGWVETFFEYLGGLASAGLENIGASEMLISFVMDGVIGGVGSVLVFLPPILLVFLAISLLEDSGYMARGAYVMDRLMTALGLHGKSFISMIIGFGCNVPGIMATRTLENKKDRMIAILINPFMSCLARLPVYVLFGSAFFAASQGWMIFSLYVLGIVIAIITAKIFSKTLFKGEPSPFVMELPPYRIPTLKGIFVHMWNKGSSFVKKATTIIFGVVVLIWVLSNFPLGVEYASEQSLIGQIGSFVAPVFKPLGFGTWQAAVALVFGLLAKEVVVGTFGVVYGVEEGSLTEVLRGHFTPLSAYAFLVMTLIYVPCVAAIGAIKRETNSWKWTAFAVGYSLVLGWILAFIVYQGGKLIGLG
ncbi:MAG: ferrous iron transport protein B [Halanaerobiales bacterium]|nr:ferrous iron transport protein B [Halanaerobiales bacterium]